jgi:uncharacterized membrane protein
VGISRASFIEMNDWPKQKCLLAVLLLQLFVWSSIIVDESFFPLPIIRPSLIFLMLTFIPGYLLLRCMRLHRLGAIESFLFAIGLSVFFLMFTGFLLNFLAPLFGFHTPITQVPLLVFITVLIMVLCIITAIWDDFGYQGKINFYGKDLHSPAVLVLFLLPFLTIIGTYLVNFRQNTVILWVVLVAVVIIFLLAGFEVIPRKYFPLVVFIIGIVLVWHNSLISMYITGSDIQEEYHFASLVIQQGIWDSNIQANINAMMSIVMLCPIYSVLLKMDPTWVFKIIYPFFFSLVPLGIYRVIQKQSGPMCGLVSIIFIFSVGTFFTLMLHVMRQQIAELFLVLLLLLMVNSAIPPVKRGLLAIFFMAGLIVSHYGLAWIYIFIFCLTVTLIYLVKFLHKESLYRRQFITVLFVSLYINMNLIWYSFITVSTLTSQLSTQFETIQARLFSSFFNIQGSQPAMIIEGGVVTPLHIISKSLHMCTLVLIAIGIFLAVTWLVFQKKPGCSLFYQEYTLTSFSNFITLGAGFVIPSLFMFSTTRVYQIVLIVLAPFSIVGGIAIMNTISRVVRFHWISIRKNQMRFFCLFFVFLLLFGTNLIYEAARDRSDSISISQKRIIEHGSRGDLINYYSTNFLEEEFFSAGWLGRQRGPNTTVTADLPAELTPLASYGGILFSEPLVPDLLPDDSFVYLRYINLNNQIVGGPDERSYFLMADMQPYLGGKNSIYSNGKSTILK